MLQSEIFERNTCMLMRISALMVVFSLFLFPRIIFGADEEAKCGIECIESGFTKDTKPFDKCVLSCRDETGKKLSVKKK